MDKSLESIIATRWDDDVSVADNQQGMENSFMVGRFPVPLKFTTVTIILPTTIQKAEAEDVQSVKEQTQGTIHKNCKESKAFSSKITIQYPEGSRPKKVIFDKPSERMTRHI
ncbi:conserved hypothetical protein [Ricinus communis]|uniref:Uncharacterized protein n=1 Tax=Ricinus communis TaxID=3988 RepID=B9SM59_RICCO|nr:conserved hypothetical protein [Ricinus communis]